MRATSFFFQDNINNILDTGTINVSSNVEKVKKKRSSNNLPLKVIEDKKNILEQQKQVTSLRSGIVSELKKKFIKKDQKELLEKALDDISDVRSTLYEGVSNSILDVVDEFYKAAKKKKRRKSKTPSVAELTQESSSKALKGQESNSKAESGQESST
jgi:plastocyanin domain-containing protein